MSKLLERIFSYVNGDKGNNWISVRFHRWRQKKKWQINLIVKAYHLKDHEFFQVPGAGEICVSKHLAYTGGAAGVSFAVSWSHGDGFGGGVLGYTEAKRLAEFLLEQCAKETRTEEEILREKVVLR